MCHFFISCCTYIVNLYPIYSAEFFGNSPFDFSFFTAIVICALGKYAALLMIGEIVILISAISKNSIISLCICFVAIILLMLFANKNSIIVNPINMLLVYKLLEKFDCTIIFGKPILSLYIALIIYIIVIIALFFIIKICTIGIGRGNLCAKTRT